MPKKAPRRAPYFFFMIDFKKREERKGEKFGNGFQDVAVFASDAWKNLPEREKERYKKMAEDYNKSEARNQGLPAIAARRKLPPPPSKAQLFSAKEAKKIAEKRYIENLVDTKTMNDLLDHVFYLIHVNIFCKTSDNEYFPAELAISKFSLRESVTGVFHRFLNAGTIPMGYGLEVKNHIEKTHRIPLDLIKSNRGYLGMYQSILNFIQESNPNEIPCLFTMFDEPFHNCSMSAVKHSLKRIWETQNTDIEEDGEIEQEDAYEKVFKIYSLPLLFFHLKQKCASFLDETGVGFRNSSDANRELLKDIYCYDTDIACQFHQEIDNVPFCSQSYVVRWARVVQEQCCKGLVAEEEEEEEKEKKQELDVSVKEDKKQLADEIKNELPGNRAIKTERDRGYENSAVKSERDRGYENVAVKSERDRGYENSAVKSERDRGYENVAVKSERDRGYENPRIKSERDRGYENKRIKSERDRGYENGRIKDERNRASESDRVKSERDSSNQDKDRSERKDDYANRHIKSEPDRGYEDRRHRSERSHDRENRHIKSERDAGSNDERRERYDDESHIIKSERNNIRSPVESSSSQNSGMRVKTEPPESANNSRHRTSPNSSVTKMEYEPLPGTSTQYVKNESPRIKSEMPESAYDKELKMEHLDIPYEPMETNNHYNFSNLRDPRRRGNDNVQQPSRDPRIQSVSSIQQPSRDPRMQNAQLRDPRMRTQAVVKTEPVSKDGRGEQINLQSSPPSNVRVKSEASPTFGARGQSQRISVNDVNDFPMPIPIKDEFWSSAVPIKREKSPTPVTPSQPSSTVDDFPMPIPIKNEFPSSDFSNVKVKQERSSPPPREQYQRPNAANDSTNDFPMPIPIKVERSGETPCSAVPSGTVASVNIKSEPSTSTVNRPGTENTPIRVKSEPTPSSSRQSRVNESPSVKIKSEPSTSNSSQTGSAPVKIKTEPNESQTSNRKRGLTSDSVDNKSGKRARPESVTDSLAEGQIRIKEEIPNYAECPPTPRRIYDECPPTPRRTQEECPPTPRRTYDECPPTPRRTYDECPPTPRRTFDECPPTPRRTYDECPPTPRRTYDECPPTPRRAYDECPPTPRRAYDECPPTPRRAYDECPPTPRREDITVKTESTEPIAPRIKTEPVDSYEMDSIYGMKHEECDLDSGNVEPMDCDQREPVELNTQIIKENPSPSHNVCDPFNMKIKEEKIFTEDEDDIKEENFTTQEDID